MMKYHAIRGGILLVLVCIVPLAGCDRPTSHQTSSDETARALVDDAALTARVKTALATDAGLNTLKLSVDSDNGIVTICGRVPDQATLETVSSLAAGVAGVVKVDNHVSVVP